MSIQYPVNIIRKTLAKAAILALAVTPAAFAQDDSLSEEELERLEDDDIIFLDAFVVTGVAEGKAIKDQSVSISIVPVERSELEVPRSTGEIFRTIPGIRSESTAGEGNTNIGVRGLPIASGGAKYLQLHEDGLPVLEFGDIAFATADGFFRPDYTVGNIEAIRGGSASTFASNSPAGVINFMSKTGEVEGGSIGIQVGLDYDSSRIDFDYGGAITDEWRMHIGGFHRTGEGIRSSGYDANSGSQIKANFTREFENGFFRLYFKNLNDSVATYLPMPVSATGSNSNPSIGSFENFDVATDTPHSVYLLNDTFIDGTGNVQTADVDDGITTNYSSVGFEISNELSNGWKLHNVGKVASVDGRFLAPFTAAVDTAQNTADTWGGPNSTLRFANGPSGGDAIANPSQLNGNGLLQLIHMFNTELNDFGNYQNNFKLKKTIEDTAAESIDLTFGYYLSGQTIDMDWHWNAYIMEVKGDNAALVDIFAEDGTAITENGLLSYGPQLWGYFRRSFDIDYDIAAPYGAASFDFGNFNIDFSLRLDTGEATGNFYNGITRENVDVNNDGTISTPEMVVAFTDRSDPKPVNYDWSYVSYSAGANYRFNDQLSVFGRLSEGGRVNADRLVEQLAPDGTIDDDAAVDVANQYELGLKYLNEDVAGGTLGLFATLFYAEVEETNFASLAQQELFVRDYENAGLEIEAEYLRDRLEMRLGLTYNDSELARDSRAPENNGNTPRRVPDWAYSFSTSYYWDKLTLGGTLIGITDVFGHDSNVLVLPGYAYVNLTAGYEISDNVQLSLAVNNAFDEFGLSEVEETALQANGSLRARGITGRSTSLTLRYRF